MSDHIQEQLEVGRLERARRITIHHEDFGVANLHGNNEIRNEDIPSL
jgi:hypothetical protein